MACQILKKAKSTVNCVSMEHNCFELSIYWENSSKLDYYKRVKWNFIGFESNKTKECFIYQQK